jgi:hypothetical protein
MNWSRFRLIFEPNTSLGVLLSWSTLTGSVWCCEWGPGLIFWWSPGSVFGRTFETVMPCQSDKNEVQAAFTPPFCPLSVKGMGRAQGGSRQGVSSVPTYSFVCDRHGEHDAVISMSALSATYPCPACDRPSRRVFHPPLLNLGDSRARRLIDATKATADEPPVVTSIPGAPRRRQKVARDPRLRNLPKPD